MNQENKLMIIDSLAAKKNMDVSAYKKSRFFQGFEKSYTDPNQVSNYFFYNNIPSLNVLGVDFINNDTSFFRALYEEGKSDIDNKIKKTTIKWEVYDFKSIPTKKYPNHEVPQILDVQNIITDIKILKDGKYVMYYEPIYDNENQSFLIDKPFCFFEIKNYTTNGEAVFLTHLGDTMAKGNYLNGKQHGNWKIKLPYTKFPNSIDLDYWKIQVNGELLEDESNIDGIFHKTGWCQYNLVYQEGVINGDYIFKIDDKVRSIGTMLDNKPIGNWKFYHSNGQLANSLHLQKEPIYLSDNLVTFPYVRTFRVYDTTEIKLNQHIPPPSVDLLPMGNERSEFLGLTSDFYLNRGTPVVLEFGKSYIRQDNGYIREEGEPYVEVEEEDYNIDRHKVIFHDKIDSKRVFYLEGLYEAFHENGQPFFSMEVNNNGEIIDFSEKIYDKDSNVIEEWYFNSKKTKVVHIMHDTNTNDKFIYKIKKKEGKRIRKEKKHIPLSVFFRRMF